MDNDERKPRLHIHLGGLVILIIIVLILFKVDIRSKIQSPQFQTNVSYIIEQTKIIWQKYIVTPVKARTKDAFLNFTTSKLEEVQNNFAEDVLNIDEKALKEIEDNIN